MFVKKADEKLLFYSLLPILLVRTVFVCYNYSEEEKNGELTV